MPSLEPRRLFSIADPTEALQRQHSKMKNKAAWLMGKTLLFSSPAAHVSPQTRSMRPTCSNSSRVALTDVFPDILHRFIIKNDGSRPREEGAELPAGVVSALQQ